MTTPTCSISTLFIFKKDFVKMIRRIENIYVHLYFDKIKSFPLLVVLQFYSYVYVSLVSKMVQKSILSRVIDAKICLKIRV